MPNHLAEENSPYLLQHKDNPVDWYPWGDEALRLSDGADDITADNQDFRSLVDPWPPCQASAQ